MLIDRDIPVIFILTDINTLVVRYTENIIAKIMVQGIKKHCRPGYPLSTFKKFTRMSMKICHPPFGCINISVRVIYEFAMEGMRFGEGILRIKGKLKNKQDKNEDTESFNEFKYDLKNLHN